MMDEALRSEIEALARMTAGELRAKHIELFGEPSRSNHKQFLYRRIAWRMQALAEGGLSERAKRRALEIANDADLRIRAPRQMFEGDRRLDPKLSVMRRVANELDPRLPPVGSCLDRLYKGQRLIVKVVANGFKFENRLYRSLSAIAREVTGTKWNGYKFFGLDDAPILRHDASQTMSEEHGDDAQ